MDGHSKEGTDAHRSRHGSHQLVNHSVSDLMLQALSAATLSFSCWSVASPPRQFASSTSGHPPGMTWPLVPPARSSSCEPTSALLGRRPGHSQSHGHRCGRGTSSKCWIQPTFGNHCEPVPNTTRTGHTPRPSPNELSVRQTPKTFAPDAFGRQTGSTGSQPTIQWVVLLTRASSLRKSSPV